MPGNGYMCTVKNSEDDSGWSPGQKTADPRRPVGDLVREDPSTPVPDLRDWWRWVSLHAQGRCLEKFVALTQDSAQSRGREGLLLPLSQVG